MRRAIQMRAEFHTFIAHFAQLAEAENLEAAGIGEQGPLPGHEAVQTAQLAHLFGARPQIKMIGIGQQDLRVQLLQRFLWHAFDSGQRSHRHKHRSFDVAMRSGQPPCPRRPKLGLNAKFERHRFILFLGRFAGLSAAALLRPRHQLARIHCLEANLIAAMFAGWESLAGCEDIFVRATVGTVNDLVYARGRDLLTRFVAPGCSGSHEWRPFVGETVPLDSPKD